MADTDGDTFVSATGVFTWMRQDPPSNEAGQAIANRLNDLAVYPPNTEVPPLIWRVGNVTDYRGQDVPAAGERIMRWEISGPEKAFINGIPPYGATANNIDELTNDNANYRKYVIAFGKAVFVSTSRTWTEGGVIKQVAPSDPDQVKQRWQYEIFAHGGIDAELSHVSGSNFAQGEHEIGYPGGVRRECIRSVRKYENGIGSPPQVWTNPFFNPAANGLAHSVSISSLPAITDFNANVVVADWIPPVEQPAAEAGSAPSDSKVAEGGGAAGGGVANSPPSGTEEGAVPPSQPSPAAPDAPIPPPVLDWKPVKDTFASLESALITRGGFARDDGTQIFFENNRWVAIKGDKLLHPPKSIIEQWPTLARWGISYIDAVLPDRQVSKTHRLHVFSKTLYVRIDERTGNFVDGLPRPIILAWPPLRDAGINIVYSILPHPSSNRVTFFGKSDYAVLEVNESGPSKLYQKGTIASRWPTLQPYLPFHSVFVDPADPRRAKFSFRDIVLTEEIEPKPTDTWHADAAPRSGASGIFGGLSTISDPAAKILKTAQDIASQATQAAQALPLRFGPHRKAAETWTALKHAGFY